jgi:hypothetical protein
MEDDPAARRPADQPTEDVVAWRSRLDRSRATMHGLRQDSARIAGAIAVTERSVAGTLHELAELDRQRGRTAVADRREARAQEAQRFAARETRTAGELGQSVAPRGDAS